MPYSMGVQTQFEGTWERIEDPNDYFTVYCWCAACPASPPPQPTSSTATCRK